MLTDRQRDDIYAEHARTLDRLQGLVDTYRDAVNALDVFQRWAGVPEGLANGQALTLAGERAALIKGLAELFFLTTKRAEEDVLADMREVQAELDKIQEAENLAGKGKLAPHAKARRTTLGRRMEELRREFGRPVSLAGSRRDDTAAAGEGRP
jgi:hypothetical protein